MHCNALKVMRSNEKLEHILNTGMFHDRKQQSFQVQYFMIGNRILHIFMDLFLSGPVLQSEIFCLKAVIAACLYGVSNSGPAHTYKQRQEATITL